MVRIAIPAILLITTACTEAPLEAEQESENAALAERVREANDAGPPIEQVVPETIGYPDMEANDLLGLACAYAPGTSMGVRVIARETDAWMKIDGELVRFAADPGSRELPAKSRTSYNGQKYSLRLDVGGTVAEGEIEATTYEGTMWLYDRWDRVIYTGSGTTNCGA
ncbi:hypothetical protein [Aurantiacibacter marinus]|uniref:Lipoprotein n=1 Tax=Aurantiacibacter marinus TaxID=874156 RepID=A0A0H0XPK3_9SPHN|nr:hypothetical protein [Aurantiacibacter marinus]KLI63837.1 hypothetical protein AAV99_09030 [Aurantiacibacter marinus]